MKINIDIETVTCDDKDTCDKFVCCCICGKQMCYMNSNWNDFKSCNYHGMYRKPEGEYCPDCYVAKGEP